MNKPKTTYDELKNMLPDYCFGKLSAEQTKAFEENINDFPELLDEVSKIKSSFENIDKELYKNTIDERTRNLSVKVNERISNQKLAGKYKYIKYLAPALSAVVLFFVVFKPFSSEVTETPAVSELITVSEVDKMLDESVNESDLLDASDSHIFEADFSALDDIAGIADELGAIYDEFAIDDLFESLDNFDSQDSQIDFTENNLYTIIDNLDENDVEQILEELNDAEIISEI